MCDSEQMITTHTKNHAWCYLKHSRCFSLDVLINVDCFTQHYFWEI